MKEAIQKMREIARFAKKYELDNAVIAKIQLSHIFAVLEFYEQTVKESGLSEDEFENGGYSDAEINCKSGCIGPCGQCKEDALPEVPDITPEWENISGEFIWCSIDSGGDEFISRTKPICYEGFGLWYSHGNIPTGRKFDMASIDWTKTLSERPK